MQASRFVASEIKNRFGAFPFTLRSIEDKRAKLGINECKTHGLVEAYPVIEEKPGIYSQNCIILLTYNRRGSRLPIQVHGDADAIRDSQGDRAVD
jgi:hypothetical protein